MIRSLILLLSLVPTALVPAQTALPTSRKNCDPRTDLNKLPGSGASLHHVLLSGSYFLSENIQCGAGQTAISIDPMASSVVIDFNGFTVMGTAAMTAVSGISCPASTTPRERVEILGASLYLFGGTAITIQSVESVVIQGATLGFVSPKGIDVDTQRSIRLEDTIIREAGIAAHLHGRDVLLRGGHFTDCATGLILECKSGTGEDLVVRGCTGDGIVLSDPSSPPGVVQSVVWSLSRIKVLDCDDDGIDVSSAGGQPIGVSCDEVTVTDCDGDGLDFNAIGTSPTGLPWVTCARSSFVGCGGSGIRVARPDADPLQVTLESVLCWGNNGDGVQISARAGVRVFCQGLRSSLNGQSGLSVVFSPGLPTTGVSDVSLSRVQCSDNGLDGFTFDASALPSYGKVSTQDLQCEGNHRDGWNVVRVDGMVSHGTFSGNARDGVHAVDSALHCSSTGVADNGEDGGDLTNAHFKSFDGKVFHNAKKGLNAVNLSRVQLTNFQIGENGEDGVYLQDSTYQGVDGTILECGFNGLHASNSRVECTGTDISSNGQDGVHLERSSGRFVQCTAIGNFQDGVNSVTLPGDPTTPLVLTDCDLSRNQGLGARLVDRAEPVLLRVLVSGNALGGVLSTSSGACSSTQCRITECTFDSNGGTACAVQNAQGGAIEHCTFAKSNIGLYVGDTSGQGCCSGVRVTDCTVSQCSTGFQVDAGGGHLVVRNFASQCPVAPFAVGAGNLFGTVIATSLDLNLNSNPNANYAQ